MNSTVEVFAPDVLPTDGQFIGWKFGDWSLPGKGRVLVVEKSGRRRYVSEHTGRFFEAGPGRRGVGVYGRDSDGSRGKLAMWSSVLEWWPLDGPGDSAGADITLD